METVEITIQRRDGKGKEGAKKLRRTGVVPGVLYGPKRTTTTVAVAAEEFEEKILNLEGSHLIRLLNPQDPDLNDKMVLVREIQVHPVTSDVLHADFYEVDLTQRLVVSVPLHFVGKAEGVIAGGILQPVMREVEVECLPTEIPEFIEIDVSALGIHDALHVSDITFPERVKPVGDGTQTIVTVLPPSVEEVKKPEVAPVEGAPVEGAVPVEGAAPGPAPAEGAAPVGGPAPKTPGGGGKRGGGEG